MKDWTTSSGIVNRNKKDVGEIIEETKETFSPNKKKKKKNVSKGEKK